MKFLTVIVIIGCYFLGELTAQSTLEPTSITLGIDQLSSVNGDTILHWGKTRSAFRGGLFQSADITNINSGMFSFAYGQENRAIGSLSFALGSFNRAKETNSFAFGKDNVVNAAGGFAFGNQNMINGSQSIVLGQNLITNSIYTIAMGSYNIDEPDPAQAEDKQIFVLGNGDRFGRSNAITVLGDGKMSLRGPTPESDLHLIHQDSFMSAGLRIQNENGGNWWRFYTRSQSDALALYNNNFMSGISSIGNFSSTGSYSSNSDRRLKKDIIELPYGLKEVLQLSPKQYQFKHVQNRKDIGLIAQEVIEIIPELVSYNKNEDKYMMNYDGYGVLAIKAIQELSAIVDDHQKVIGELIAQLKDINEQLPSE